MDRVGYLPSRYNINARVFGVCCCGSFLVKESILADDADVTDRAVEVQLDASVATVRYKASQIIEGKPGECDRCGEESLRLVGGACAPCRDRLKLP